MSNTTLKNLLTEYENKRMRAIKLAEQRKKELYIQNPKLQEIDDKLNALAISTAKSLINKNDSELLKNLEKNINILKKEKILILNSIGKDESYILPNYACKLCNDTGYVMQNSHSIMCSCLKQKIFDLEYNKSNIYNIKNQNFNNFNDLFYSNVVDEKKYKSDISPRENIKLIKDKVYLNGEDVTEKIRSNEVSNIVSPISNYIGVRESMLKLQRDYAKEKSVVMEGRDITTVVFPNADFKFYLDASLEERARRRFLQNKQNNISTSYEEVLENIKKRDYNDLHKPVGALKRSKDAVYIDSTNKSIDEVVNIILENINRKESVE